MHQVKILRDIRKPVSTVKGRSRGVAFIEFGEHEHAIVALRVLNNNPGLTSSFLLTMLIDLEKYNFSSHFISDGNIWTNIIRINIRFDDLIFSL